MNKTLITFLSVFLLTGLHDPILHEDVAYTNARYMTDFDKVKEYNK